MAAHNTPAPLFEIDPAKWRLIEGAYGAPLQSNMRAEIVRATEVFLLSENLARTGEGIARVKVILEAHDKAATRFFNELFGSASSVSDAGVYAHHLIDNNFKPARSRNDKAGLDSFLDCLRAFHIACNSAIKELTDPSAEQKGERWRVWLNRLAEIFEGDKPVRGAGGVGHRIVKAVGELQKLLPPEYHRDQAAIARALLETRSKS